MGDFCENFHMLLCGSKEFILNHPSDVAVLHGTRLAPEATWTLVDGGDAKKGTPPRVELRAWNTQPEQGAGTKILVKGMASITASFEENSALLPGLRRAAERRTRDIQGQPLTDKVHTRKVPKPKD